MSKMLLMIMILVVNVGVNGQSIHEQIRAALLQLQSATGIWQVETRYQPREGEASVESGTLEISWQLDSTYLELHAELKNPKTGKSWQYNSWITYDLDKKAYRQTYFYSKSARVVIESGNWDTTTSVLTTLVTLNLPDGTVEDLRNEWSLKVPDRMVYLGWASFDGAEAVNNFRSVMTRIKK